MKPTLQVIIRQQDEHVLTDSADHAMGVLQHILSNGEFDITISVSDSEAYTMFGQRKACILYSLNQNPPQIFCLSKRNQTPRTITACGRSETHLHHRVLQNDDILLITGSILHGKPVPDAYHLEPLTV